VTRRLRERLDGAQTGEGGYTLVEMVVVIFILAIVLAVVQTTMIMTQRTVTGNGIRVDQSSQARQAMEAVTKTLRTAVLPSLLNCYSCTDAAFISGTKNSVKFYANINNNANTVGPSRVSYVVSATGDLTETIQPPDAHAVGDYNYTYCTPSVSCPVISRVIARGVPVAQTIFTYYDKSGTAFASSTLSASDLKLVDSIDVVLVVNGIANGTVPGTTLTQRVTLPNADSVAIPTPSP